MKKNILKTILASAILPFALASLSSCSYYWRVNDSMEGDTLKAALRLTIDHTTPINYEDVAKHYPKTDADPEKARHIILFYTGQSVSTLMTDYDYHPYGAGDNDINREHVWPQSRFRIYGALGDNAEKYGKAENPGPATDLYNVRPALGAVNTSRSNYFYGEDMDTLYDPYTSTEGGQKEFRGEIARIIFYCATRYEKLELTDDYADPTSNIKTYKMGRVSELLKWNLEEAVNEREIVRNDEVEKIQGNRNPFVDHPEYACRIWGRFNDATKSVCGYK